MNTDGLAHTLQEEHQAALRLLELLKQEQQCLIAANVDEMMPMIEEKAALVTRMSALSSRRFQVLSANGFRGEEAGMKDWLSSAASTSTLQDTWRAMLDTARAAKELNRVNGLLINRHMQINRGAISELLGDQVQDNFYGPNGQSTSKTSSRNLVIG